MLDQPLPLTLRPKKSTAVWLIIISALFVAAGLAMAGDRPWVGYFCAAFFSLGILVGTVSLLPGSTYLHISEDGVTMCSMFRTHFLPWHVIDRFFVVEMKSIGLTCHRMIGFDYAASYDRHRTSRLVASALADCEGSLHDTCGQDPDELAAFLNACLIMFTSDDENRNEDAGSY